MGKEKTTEEYIQLYIDEKKRFLDRFPTKDVIKSIEIVWEAYLNDNTVFACGNGGNAAYVANMITDLSMHPFVSDNKDIPMPIDVKRLRTIDLVSSPATLTAILNVIGPDDIFSQQLINHRVKQGDVVFGFSGSGNSKNVLEAFKTAKKYLATTIGITRGDRGKIKGVADLTIITPGTSEFPGQTAGNNFNFHFEDALSSIAHMITGIIKKRVHEEYMR